MKFLVQTINYLTSDAGHQNEADVPGPFLHLIKSKNICLLNINGKSKTNSSQTLHLRWSSEMFLCMSMFGSENGCCNENEALCCQVLSI